MIDKSYYYFFNGFLLFYEDYSFFLHFLHKSKPHKVQ